MKFIVVATRDVLSNLYGAPMYVVHENQAIRTFGDTCQDDKNDNNTMAKHPEDFELWKLGEYDDHTGEFNQEDRRQLAAGASFRKS